MLPGWNYVELRGTFTGLNGPDSGVIEFTPTDSFEAVDGSYQILPVPIPVLLDATGSFSVMLIATDNVTQRNNTWRWHMAIRTETIRHEQYLTLEASQPVVYYTHMEEP